MELKTARLTILIDPNKKAAFENLCAQQDRTASQVIRQLIREYLVQHGVEYVPSGLSQDDVAASNSTGISKSDTKKSAKRNGSPPARRQSIRRGA